MPVIVPVQFKIKCPLCEWSVALPRRSPLGIYDDAEYRRTPSSWPTALICLAHEQVCECSYDRVSRKDMEEQGHSEYPAALWGIVCACIQEGCSMNLTAYTFWDSSEAARPELIDRVVKTKPTGAFCSSGHEIKWHPEKIKATIWPF
jgi:hypothetical protein